jgi:hypothetical protein
MASMGMNSSYGEMSRYPDSGANHHGENQHRTRVARFFMAQHTQTGKNIPNNQIPNGDKIYQMAVK